MINVNQSDFPIRQETIYLNNCGVAPLFAPAAEAAAEFLRARSRQGAGVFAEYGSMNATLRSEAAKLLSTSSDNVAFIKNTAEGLSMIALGYPFQAGDEIISYVHEYPSNHYPWKLSERRGAVLRLLPDRTVHLTPQSHEKLAAEARQPLDRAGLPGPCAWSMADLADLVTERTRLVAVSHVQFTSGFAADLQELGAFCKEREIDLVIDAAQSMGCLPIIPEEWHISAVACSGWKWLLGPLGSGLLYTSPSLRAKLAVVMAGAEVVEQAPDYLDHSWNPHTTARVFEYSTPPAAGVVALGHCLRELWNKQATSAVRDHVVSLQDTLLAELDPALYQALLFEQKHRSGILSLISEAPVAELCTALQAAGVFVTSRGGYLRVAPHIYLNAEDMKRAAMIMNEIAAQSLP